MRTRNVDYAAINHTLLASARILLSQWLPGGKTQGREYVVRNPLRADARAGSFSINTSTGKWADFATGEQGGDLISLYAYLHGLKQHEAAQSIQNGSQARPPANIAKPAKVLPPVHPSPGPGRLFSQASAITQETPAGRYLKNRGIDNWPGDAILRQHPNLWHSEAKCHFPAMLAAVRIWPNQQICGLHRTYLNPNSDQKLSYATAKKMLGTIATGAVQLSPPGEILAIAEGIESALSFEQLTGHPCWAALSTSNLATVKLPNPAQTPHVLIAADNDTPGIKAANKAAEHYTNLGHRVRIIMPPDHALDFNALLMDPTQ